MKNWIGTSTAIHSSLDPSLVGLVEIRASQINGCANCLNMHTVEARARGERPTSSRSGDMKALGTMLAADVSVHVDGGGKRPAALQPISGFDAVMKVHEHLATFFRKNGSKLVRAALVNGLPGFITLEADGELQTTALEIESEKIVAIYVVQNPDKLRHLH